MRKVIFGSIIFLFLVVGCNEKSNSDWSDTEEKAIEYGLEEEGVDESAILSIEEYEGETIVFFEKAGALGVASITKNNQGYRWFKSTQYYDFNAKGDIPYTTGGFSFDTETGLTVSVIHGKVFDSSIQKMNLSGDESERDLKIFKDSKIYYSIHQQPFSQLDVSPVIE